MEFCRKNGIEFYAVNKNYPEEVLDETVSRRLMPIFILMIKISEDFPGWSEVWQMLNPFELQQKEAEKRIHQQEEIFLNDYLAGKIRQMRNDYYKIYYFPVCNSLSDMDNFMFRTSGKKQLKQLHLHLLQLMEIICQTDKNGFSGRKFRI